MTGGPVPPPPWSSRSSTSSQPRSPASAPEDPRISSSRAASIMADAYSRPTGPQPRTCIGKMPGGWRRGGVRSTIRPRAAVVVVVDVERRGGGGGGGGRRCGPPLGGANADRMGRMTRLIVFAPSLPPPRPSSATVVGVKRKKAGREQIKERRNRYIKLQRSKLPLSRLY